jgi:dolichol-phosphate mannosyltransferase
LRFAELPYHFRQRKHGESKLDGMAVWEYGMLLSDKLFGRFISPRFLLFCIVGGFGLFVHMVALGTALYTGFAFLISQTIAAICSTGSNFILNNVITYRDQRRTGWGLVLGLLYFYAICSVGLLANIGIARFVYAEQPLWWLAGLPGAIVGVVWNYTASAVFIWNRR